MRRWISICFLFTAVLYTESSERIISGTPTSVEKYPSIVQVEFRASINTWSQRCAANILTTRYVLSAAHCYVGIFSDARFRRIRAGSSDRNAGGIVINVANIINHPTFGEKDYDGDIALLLLETPLVYSDVIASTSIVAQGATIPDNLRVTHVGWGMQSFPSQLSPILNEVDIYTINNKLCAERYITIDRVVTPNMICAGLLDVGGAGACYGDSGGPLYYEDILIGVVSWGHFCANETFPDVSASVSSYTDWIVVNAV